MVQSVMSGVDQKHNIEWTHTKLNRCAHSNIKQNYKNVYFLEEKDVFYRMKSRV